MTAELTDMRSFIDIQRRRIPEEIHPMAQQIVHQWLGEMGFAAEAGDSREVNRLLAMVRDKISDELRWQAHKYQLVKEYKAAYRLRRQADRYANAAHGRGA